MQNIIGQQVTITGKLYIPTNSVVGVMWIEFTNPGTGEVYSDSLRNNIPAGTYDAVLTTLPNNIIKAYLIDIDGHKWYVTQVGLDNFGGDYKFYENIE